jgi:hypothetical protein
MRHTEDQELPVQNVVQMIIVDQQDVGVSIDLHGCQEFQLSKITHLKARTTAGGQGFST